MSDAMDHLALHNLYGRYCFALDYGTTDELLDCFTADGTFSLSDRGDFVGHAQIRTIIDASAQSRNRHQIMNLVVDSIADGRAVCRAYFLLIRTADAATMSYGHYRDTAVKCADGIWRWDLKRVIFDWRAPEYAVRSQSQTTDKLLGRSTS